MSENRRFRRKVWRGLHWGHSDRGAATEWDKPCDIRLTYNRTRVELSPFSSAPAMFAVHIQS